MGSGVVQFRVDEQEIAWLRSQGYNPNEFAREGMLRYLRRVRAEAAHHAMAGRRGRLPGPVEDLVRAMRDEQAGAR